MQTLKTVQDAYKMKSELEDNKKKVYDELKKGTVVRCSSYRTT
ncbi:hypothetical protein HS9_00554 [Bacillus velezensis]|nr:hypothetical protein HS9_00554 [Bacillus velezensis]